MADEAEARLRELLRSVARDQRRAEHALRLRPVTSDGANYTSNLFLATISSPDLPPLELFAKVACISEKLRSRFNADSFYRVEQTFYNRLYKVWSRFEEEHQVPEQHRLVVPKFYAGDLELGMETVVLENLVAAGYGSYNRFKSVDWEHAAKAVEVLAKIHAFSYVHAREEPEQFAELVKELKFDMKRDDGSEMMVVWEKMIEGAVAAVDERYKARVKEFFEVRIGVDLYEKYHSPTRAPVLAHGDYRPSNLLFKKQADGVHAIALDFQTMHSGCPMEDLVYFIFIGSDEAFRKEHYHQLVEHYYLQLGLALARFQVEIDEVYPREHFDEDLKEYLPYALLLGVTILPVVTVEAESAPKIDGDADLDSFVVAPNELYASRFSGIVNDLVRWGVI